MYIDYLLAACSVMLQLNLPCCIFDKNEPEEFQNVLEMVDALAKSKLDKALPKFNADQFNESKIYLKRIEILNKEVISNNEFYAMHMKELHQKHNDHQFSKTIMYEMRVKEAVFMELVIWR